MIGGGVPKNFIQDKVICALLGKEVYASTGYSNYSSGLRDGV